MTKTDLVITGPQGLARPYNPAHPGGWFEGLDSRHSKLFFHAGTVNCEMKALKSKADDRTVPRRGAPKRAVKAFLHG